MIVWSHDWSHDHFLGKMLAIMDAPIMGGGAEFPQQYTSLASIPGWDKKVLLIVTLHHN